MTTFYVMMMEIFGSFDQQILAGKFPELAKTLPKPLTPSDPAVFVTAQNHEKKFCTVCENNGATVQG